MSKYCPENERVKRDYAFYMTAANGKQNATIDAALRAIERFETSTKFKPFRKFHVEQVRSFRTRLSEELNAHGKPLSAATITSTLKHLRAFFLWLSREPGFRSVLNENDANHFTPSEQDVRIATATREKRVASLDEIKRVFSARTFGSHAVEFRRSIRLFGKAYYVVFLLGRERRTRAQTGARIPGTLIVLALLVLAGYAIYMQMS